MANVFILYRNQTDIIIKMLLKGDFDRVNRGVPNYSLNKELLC